MNHFELELRLVSWYLLKRRPFSGQKDMKTSKKKNARFSVSFPLGLLKTLERRRLLTKRSRNQEIVYLIEQAIKTPQAEVSND